MEKGIFINRKTTRKALASAAIGFSVFLAVCTPDFNSPPDNNQNLPGVISPDYSIDQWRYLNPIERLTALENKNQPESKEFDFTKEIDLAAVEFFCEQVKCPRSPEEIISSIKHVDQTFFIGLQEKALGRPLTSEEKINIGFYIKDAEGNRYINDDAVKRKSKELNFTGPLEGKDSKAIVLKDVLFNSAADEAISNEDMNFKSPIAYSEIPPLPAATFLNMERLIPKGFDETNKPTSVDGLQSAIEARIAEIVAERSGTHSVMFYKGPSQFIASLNLRAGISDEEFLQYMNGTLPKELWLFKLGQLRRDKTLDPVETMIKVLISVGLAQDEIISYNELLEYANRYLNLVNTPSEFI